MGMASLLIETPLNREQLDYARTIRKSGENLLATVNGILAGGVLNLSKSGQQEETPPESRDFDLRDCIEEVLQLFAAQTARTGVHLLYDLDPEVPEQIRGDRKRLSQVLVNLVENAVRHTEKGEVTVSVGLLGRPHKDSLELCFEVKDTGSGISPEKIDQLLKGLAAPETAGDGDKPAGLGLVICKRLVETMQGFIQASGEPGQGSSFTFSIIVADSKNPARRSAGRQLTAFEGKQVLVVDAHAARRTIMARRLERMKLAPLVAGSARQALDLLAHHPAIQLLLLDTGLPEKELTDLAAAARSHAPQLPLVGLGGSIDTGGAALSYPLRQHELSDRLLDCLSRPAATEQRQPEGPRLESSLAVECPLRILVAEDHPVNQKLALAVLAKLGYQPDMAANGKEALDKVSHQAYDIILMDVQMPEMDGLEATRMIRRCVQPQPVIIAMTANAMQGDRDGCLQAGMDDYISKPLEIDELVAQLRKWCAVVRTSQPR
jgi:CheY-like chemotaxis protein